jgi:hypothetical protein
MPHHEVDGGGKGRLVVTNTSKRSKATLFRFRAVWNAESKFADVMNTVSETEHYVTAGLQIPIL